MSSKKCSTNSWVSSFATREFNRDGLDFGEESSGQNKPQAIERILHKYELEIRAHVKMEQEFRRLAEEAEKKYDTLRVEFNSVLTKYNKMIDRLSDMAYQNEALSVEVTGLRAFISEAQDGHDEARESAKKVGGRGLLGSVGKEKSVKKDRNFSNDHSKTNAQKIKNVCLADVVREQFHSFAI